MYLIERIIGIATYMIIMLAMVYLIYKSPKEKLKKLLIIYLIFLFIMAYFYIPATSADLYRLTNTMKYYASFGISNLPQLLLNSKAPVYVLYSYIIGKLGIDNLLPAITSLIFYSNIFIIFYKSSKKFNLSNKSTAISLLLFMEMGKFLEVISSVRTMLAFSFIALCCYNEFIEKRSIIKDILFYLIASLIHPAAMVLALIRMVFLLFQKERKILKKLFNFTLLIIISVFTLKYGKEYLDLIFQKADTYLNGDVYSYVWEYLVSWICILFSTYSLLFRKKELVCNIDLNNLRKFNLFINAVILLFSFEYSIFSRYQAFSNMIFIPIIGVILNNVFSEESIRNRKYMFMVIMVSTLLFFIVGLRGNLSSYKYLLFD